MQNRAAWSEDRARSIILSCQNMRGALLPMLHGLQEAFGSIDAPAIPLLADALNVSQAEIHGVVSFYHDFRRTRPGHYVIKVCRAEACQSMGADALVAHAKRHLSLEEGETTPDDIFTLKTVFCLGNCALAPAVMVDETLYGRVGIDRFNALVTAHREDVQ